MIKHISLSFLIFCLQYQVSAQNKGSYIYGRVVRCQDTLPIADAKVLIAYTGTSTDKDGYYKLRIPDSLSGRKINIECQSPDYITLKRIVELKDLAVRLDFKLIQDASDDGDLLVNYKSSKNGYIYGKVINSKTNEPVPNANIYTAPGSMKCKTDKGGNYKIYIVPNVLSGDRINTELLFISKLCGYETYRKKLSHTKLPKRINIQMRPTSSDCCPQ